MTVDLSAANDFMATHARVLDRRRFELLNGETDPSAALAALDGYCNPDGGYGWGLEADLRSPESQPGAALHAFEVFEEIGPAAAPRAVALCDWLDSISLPDGGLPMALPLSMTAGESRPEAPDLLRQLGSYIPENGLICVTGGTEDELLRPLDVAPYPDRPTRDVFPAAVVSADLERLAGLQQEDGGWIVDHLRISPAGSLDWRGHATVRAIDILRRNGRTT